MNVKGRSEVYTINSALRPRSSTPITSYHPHLLLHSHLARELPSKALLHQRHISPPRSGTTRRRKQKLIRSGERPSGPARISKINITVNVEEVQHRADTREAGRVSRTSTGLGKDCLAANTLQPCRQRRESVRDSVGHAVYVGTGVIRIEVLVDIEDEVLGRAVEVEDLA